MNITYIPPTKNVGESVADINKNFEELANAVDTIDSGSTEGIKELQDTITAVGEKVDTKSDKDHTHSPATTSANGLMSATDKAKLDGIATGANAYVLPTASATTLGGVKTTSTVLSATGHTPCPIISGVPYYKNTTYSALQNPYALTLQGNGTTLTNGTYDGSAAKTVNITPSSIGAATSSHTHSYLPLSGGTLTGSVTAPSFNGNATSASKLATARTINGVSFDGSADITLPSGKTWKVGGQNPSVGWYKFMSKDMGAYESFNMVLAVTQRYSLTSTSILRIAVRRDDTAASLNVKGLYWLVRATTQLTGSVAAIIDGTTIDFYIYENVERWGSIDFTVISEYCKGTAYTTYNSATPIDDVTPDKVSADEGVVFLAKNATSATSASTVSHSYSNNNGWYQMLLGTATTGTVTETPVGNSSILANPSTGVISAAKFHQTNGGKILYDGSIGSSTGSITISGLTDYNAVLIVTDGVGISGTGSNVTAVLPIDYLAKGNEITVGGGIPSTTKSYDQGTSQALTGIDGKLTASIDTSDKTTINLTQSVGVIGNIKVYSL